MREREHKQLLTDVTELRQLGRRAIRLKAAWIDGWLERHAQGAPVLSNSTPGSAA